jgi:Lrp/AsnC family leucine-responsive transcriptional regulator
MQTQNNYTSQPKNKATEEDKAIDIVDRRILSALSKNGRLTVAELSEQVGLSSSPCWTRLKRLEARGAISGYAAIINAKEVGIPETFFIEITLDHHDGDSLERFGMLLADMPEVLEAHLVTGDYDYLVKVAVTSSEHYERFLRNTLYRVKGIRHTRSTFALRTLKHKVSVDPLMVTRS